LGGAGAHSSPRGPEWRAALSDALTRGKDRIFASADRLRGYPWLRREFERRVGQPPQLDPPRTLNEKVTWRKLHVRDPLYPVIADKVAVRGHLTGLLGARRAEPLLTDLLGVSDRPTAEWLAGFGTGIAIKANHASGWNLFVREGETPDWEALARITRRWLRRRYGVRKQEWAYSQVRPRILVERLLTYPDGRLADDLKFWVFDGICQVYQIERDRFGSPAQGIYDRNWQQFPLRMREDVAVAPPLPPPARLEELRALAEEIAAGHDYLRVDFLMAGQRFALNELTIYRGSGMNRFVPDHYDREFGDMWTLGGRR